MAELTYTVTVASGNLYGGGTGNVYYLDGSRNATGPGTITWVNGATLRFEQSDNSNDNHPLIFSTNTSTSGIISSGVTYYLDGASNQANYTNTTTFNAATTRYVEVTPSSESDFYYLCYVHGIGMGGIFDITQSAWGAQTWGFGNWNVLGDTNITLTGVQSSTSLGSADAQSVPGWGALTWGAGEWGDLKSPEVGLTGVQLTSALGTAVGRGGASVDVTGVSATGSAGQLSYIATYQVSGSSITTTLGNEFGGEVVTVPVSTASKDAWGFEAWGAGAYGVGDGITANIGTAVITASATTSLTGVSLTPSVATAVAGASALVLPTGVSATTTLGNEFGGEVVEVPVTSPVNDEWGTEPWGQGFWGVGDGVTLFIGSPSFSITAEVAVTGVNAGTSLGTVEQNTIYDVTSATATTAVGSAFGGELVQVSVSTASTQPWGNEAWGAGQWGQSVGTDISIGQDSILIPSIDVIATGVSCTPSLGSVSISGTASLSVTGQALSVQLGDEDAFTNVTANVTGNSIGTIVIGDFLAGISVLVEPTGVTGTSTTGTIGLNAWEIVDPGLQPTWTEVDKAA